jgi:hypothetical protein
MAQGTMQVARHRALFLYLPEQCDEEELLVTPPTVTEVPDELQFSVVQCVDSEERLSISILDCCVLCSCCWRCQAAF